MSFMRQLLYSIAEQLGRKKQDLQPYIVVLQKNMYQNESDLKSMSISDFDHLDIPRRISGMIMERIGTNSKGQQPKKSMQTMEMDIQVSLTQLLNSLKSKVNKQNFEALIDSLLKLFRNVKNNLMEQKYRRIKKGNKKIGELLKYRECYQIIKYGGFEQNESTFLMDQPNLYRIDECVHEISKFHEGSQFNPFKAEIMNLNEKGVPLSQMEGQTSFIFTQRLAQLQRDRERIMSKPVKDRQIKYFLDNKGTQMKPQKAWYDQRDQTQEQRQYAARIKQKLMHFGEESQFLNRRKQEYLELMKKPVFSQILVKVKLPDNWAFQCKFSPLQTLGDLVNIFHQHLNYPNIDYYLYMTPPVQKLRGILLRSTFYDAGCVPKAIFHFKTQDKVSGDNLLKIKSNKMFGIF